MIISELARAFGVRPSTLRYYERVGILAPAGRVAGRRQYDDAAQQRLALILSAKESGFTLVEIKRLISSAERGTSPRVLWRSAAATKRMRLAREIEKLKAMQESLDRKAACRCRAISDCEAILAREPLIRRPH